MILRKRFVGSMAIQVDYSLIVFALMLLITGCKKEDQKVFPSGNVTEKVLSWLNKQSLRKNTKNFKAQEGDDNIEVLKTNLNFDSARTEELDKDYSFLVIPIKDELKLKKRFSKNSMLNLLLVLDNNGIIKAGTVSYFQFSNEKKAASLSFNTYQSIYRYKPVKDDGIYKFFSVSGRWIGRREYRNGKLFSLGTVISNKKIDTTNSSRTTDITCIDWYLVTTYYFADGGTETTREYVGTTCEGECGPSDPTGDSWDCSGGGGGGGNGEVPAETQITQTYNLSNSVDEQNQDPNTEASTDPTADLGTDFSSSGSAGDQVNFQRVKWIYTAELSVLQPSGQITSYNQDPLELTQGMLQFLINGGGYLVEDLTF